MEKANKELNGYIVELQKDAKSRNISPFEMKLQGIIDANVNGGLMKYQDAFFGDSSQKISDPFVIRLKKLINEQMDVIEEALKLHKRLMSEKMAQLHEHLTESFKKLKGMMGNRRNTMQTMPLPLPPTITNSRNDEIYSFGGCDEDEYTIYEDPKPRPIEAVAMPIPTYKNDFREESHYENHSATPPPPIPSRQKFEPRTPNPDAPPLPPKGVTPDKRSSNSSNVTEPDFGSSRQLPLKGITPDKRCSNSSNATDSDIPSLPRKPRAHLSVDSSDGYRRSDGDYHYIKQLERDSGISTSANDLNQFPLPMLPIKPESNASLRGHHKTNSNPESFKQLTKTYPDESSSSPPPPIPPKSSSHHNNLFQYASSIADFEDVSPTPPFPYNDGDTDDEKKSETDDEKKCDTDDEDFEEQGFWHSPYSVPKNQKI